MRQSGAIHPLRYLATHYWSLQGLRLVPLSLICFWQPPSRAGWFGASLSLRRGTDEAVIAQLIVLGAALAGWFWLGRYYRRRFGEIGRRASGVQFWTRFLGAWLIYFLLLPAGKRLHLDVGALWFAALCVREARLRVNAGFGFHQHYVAVAGGLFVWAFVPLLVAAREPAAWAMSDLLLGICGLVIAVGDHLALRHTMDEVSAVVQQPPFLMS
jgi:hypothetical protein